MNKPFLLLLSTLLTLALACNTELQPEPTPLSPSPTPVPTNQAPLPSPTAPLPTATPAPVNPTEPPLPPDTGAGPTQPPDTQTATVVNVVDGDTIEVSDGRRVRYIGINTPERNQPYYAEASNINRQLTAGKTIQLELDIESIDQYGRTLAYVWADGVLVNLEIVRQGYANAFTVPPNVKYEAQFRNAERDAREAGRGLWTESQATLTISHINANAPGDDTQNPNGEWVEIINQGSAAVAMQGYTLKDEANHIYTFGSFSLAPNSAVRLFSGPGQNTPTQLYWGYSGESVWNNGGDTAFLRDAGGALVDSYTY